MKSISSALISVIPLFFPGLALAASDTTSITFNGTVLANTCTLSSGSKEQFINLYNIADRDIKGKGTTGGEKEVNMVLRDCGAAASAVIVRAWGDGDDNDTSAFKNAVPASEGGSEGVGLYFYQTDGKTKFIPDGSVTQTSKLTSSADNTLIYKATYAGTKDTVAAGKFNTVVNINFEYQ